VSRIYTRISVVIKTDDKYRLKTFTDLNCPDKLITNRSKLLPKNCEILEMAVGERFYKLFQKKYKKKL